MEQSVKDEKAAKIKQGTKQMVGDLKKNELDHNAFLNAKTRENICATSRVIFFPTYLIC